MRILTVIAFLSGGLAIAGAADTRARAALAATLARRDPPDPYPAARARAIAEGRTLVVWVNCAGSAEAATPQFHHLRVARFPGIISACVVIGQPSNGELWKVATLAPAEATPERLRLFDARAPRCGPWGCSR